MKWREIIMRSVVVAIGAVILFNAPPVHAISSPNYTIEEDFFGSGGSPESGSSNYQASDTVGAPAVGGSEGTDYKTDSGATTSDEPTLSFAVNTANVDLGALNPTLTQTGTATFSVLNYTSYGYVVQTVGSPPSSGTHTLAGVNPALASNIGTEQFGMNVVENTSPTTFGASPVQVPDTSFSFGQAASGYDVANTFKYVSGDVIASAGKSSGQTDYTLSYVANISTDTPGGTYTGEQTLVVVGTY